MSGLDFNFGDDFVMEDLLEGQHNTGGQNVGNDVPGTSANANNNTGGGEGQAGTVAANAV